jgi:hypothetical protein
MISQGVLLDEGFVLRLLTLIDVYFPHIVVFGALDYLL